MRKSVKTNKTDNFTGDADKHRCDKVMGYRTLNSPRLLVDPSMLESSDVHTFWREVAGRGEEPILVPVRPPESRTAALRTKKKTQRRWTVGAHVCMSVCVCVVKKASPLQNLPNPGNELRSCEQVHDAWIFTGLSKTVCLCRV